MFTVPEQKNLMLNISSPLCKPGEKLHFNAFYAIPQYHVSICVINNTLSSVKKKPLLFFSQRESFINDVWSPNTFFFTNVTGNYTFWNINLSIQTYKDRSNYFFNLSNHYEKQLDWLFGGSYNRYFWSTISEHSTAMGQVERRRLEQIDKRGSMAFLQRKLESNWRVKTSGSGSTISKAHKLYIIGLSDRI